MGAGPTTFETETGCFGIASCAPVDEVADRNEGSVDLLSGTVLLPSAGFLRKEGSIYDLMFINTKKFPRSFKSGVGKENVKCTTAVHVLSSSIVPSGVHTFWGLITHSIFETVQHGLCTACCCAGGTDSGDARVYGPETASTDHPIFENSSLLMLNQVESD